MSSAQPELLIATRNPGKMREYGKLLREAPFQLVSLDDLGITGEVDETGETFRDNAVLKASSYAAMSGILALADDSGLAVDALDGDPGVRSARYGEQSPNAEEAPPASLSKSPLLAPLSQRGVGGISPGGLPGKMSDQDRVQLLLRNLEGVPWKRRTARFRCVICIAGPTPHSSPFAKSPLSPPFPKGGCGDLLCFEGAVAGMIQYEPKGDQGFGYDPVFFLPSYGRTMAQISLEEKNRVSHRADAAHKAVAALNKLNADA